MKLGLLVNVHHLIDLDVSTALFSHSKIFLLDGQKFPIFSTALVETTFGTFPTKLILIFLLQMVAYTQNLIQELFFSSAP